MNLQKISILFSLIVLFTPFHSSCKRALRTYVSTISNNQQFQELEGEPLSLKYGGITTVKILYDIERKQVYFMNSKLYKYHFEFAQKNLGYTQDLYYFNKDNYSPNNRRQYVFAVINHYKGSDLYTYEFASSEELAEEAFVSFEEVQKKFYLGEQLKFFPNTESQIELTKKMKPNLHFITADEIYKNQVYQPIVAKECYGYLRKYEVTKIANNSITKKDIIIVNGTPNEIPLCAGIITSQMQAPLSHINILCHNRGTPIMACRTIWSNKYIESLKNELVHLTIQNDTFYVEKASLEEAQTSWNQNKIKSVKPAFDLRIDSLIDLKNSKVAILKTAGGKAYGLTELIRLQKRKSSLFSVPSGAFAIPFYFYNQHIQHASISILIMDLLNDSSALSNSIVLKSKLKAIQKAIKHEAIDPKLLHDVETKMRSYHCGNTFRFRSSTNAEDIEGFNGAGLYDSKSGILNDTNKSVEKAIKAVWASLWNERAFLERHYFGIDQHNVYMGVLCHKAFGTEEVNGVAITKNIYREDMAGTIINMQKGEASIVIPTDSMSSEHAILYSSDLINEPKFSIDFISYSSLNNNKPLLTQKEYMKLSKALDELKIYFFNRAQQNKIDFLHFAMDVEFKFVGKNRTLFIKQARVYND